VFYEYFIRIFEVRNFSVEVAPAQAAGVLVVRLQLEQVHHVEGAGVLVGEAVVVLASDGGGDQQVQGGDLFPPGQVVADGQPLGVLVEHGVDDMHEGFVGGEEAVPPGQQIPFQHAFHGVLAEHFHYAAVVGHFGTVAVLGEIVGDPEFLADFVDRLQLVGGVFFRRGRTRGNCSCSPS